MESCQADAGITSALLVIRRPPSLAGGWNGVETGRPSVSGSDVSSRGTGRSMAVMGE